MGVTASLQESSDGTIIDVQNDRESEDVIRDLPSTIAANKARHGSNMASTAPKPHNHLLVTRQSMVINYYDPFEIEQEEHLEKKVLDKSKGLKKVLDGYKNIEDRLRSSKAKKVEHLAELHELLQKKIVETFQKYEKDEERHVMANKIARTG